MQCVIGVFRVLSGGDEVRALVTRLFPQGHNRTCHTGEFTKLNLFNVTGKFYHVTLDFRWHISVSRNRVSLERDRGEGYELILLLERETHRLIRT